MAITIRDVAKQAGVAPSTVSRVVANSPSISEKTKKKVRRVMDELNYYPNVNAQGLASSRSKTFGLILPPATDAFYQNPFFPTVLRGINYSMSKNDYSILLSAGQTQEQRLNHLKKIVYGKQVEGLIFLYASKEDPLLTFAQEAGCPSVVIGSPESSKVNFVDNDNETLGYLVTKHLMKEGAQKIAYVGGDIEQFFIADRLAGYKKALKENNLEVTESAIFNNFMFLPLDGYDLMMNNDQFENFDALVIADELVANGIRQALNEKGWSHIKTISFSAYKHLLDNLVPGEAYVNLNSHLLGSRAVDILFDVIKETNAKNKRFMNEYIEGELVT